MRDFGIKFWIHMVVIAIVWTWPFMFTWYYFFIGLALFYIQNYFLGYCVVTKWEFGKTNETFHGYYTKKLGFNFKKRNLDRFINYGVPAIVIALSLFWQVVLKIPPLLF